MMRDILRRLEALEQVAIGPEPIVIILSPVQAPGFEWQCSAYVCQHTGFRVDRAPGEPMADLVERAEHEAEQYAADKRPPFMLLQPDELEATERNSKL